MWERRFYQEDSPWVEMKELNWSPLTEGQPGKQFFKGHIFYNQQEHCQNVFIIRRGRVAMETGGLCTFHTPEKAVLAAKNLCAYAAYRAHRGEGS